MLLINSSVSFLNEKVKEDTNINRDSCKEEGVVLGLFGVSDSYTGGVAVIPRKRP